MKAIIKQMMKRMTLFTRFPNKHTSFPRAVTRGKAGGAAGDQNTLLLRQYNTAFDPKQQIP
ncbi:MAG: hypothetical protein FWG31_07445 [Oscillospiraceae bacterium]|nr:hypothetical protein [Oscillospiraceae bacterium]